MIIVFGGVKGGEGKSTLACNAAVIRSSKRDVLLVDGDKQATATDFTLIRKETRLGQTGYTAVQLRGTALRDEVKQLALKYEDVIIDVGGRDTVEQRCALAVANVYAVPFCPSSFDLWTLEQVAELVEEASAFNPNLHALCFLSRADSRGKENEAAIEVAQEISALTFIDAPITNRKIYRDASASGLAISEYKPRNTKAELELLNLFDYLFDPKFDIKNQSKKGVKNARQSPT
jgi:chromosome partitioning protein